MILTGEAFSVKGRELLARITAALEQQGHTFVRHFDNTKKKVSLSKRMQKAFESSEGIIFVGACGIAVRGIAPYLKSKTTDPAVVVVDEKGQWAISLLSGHLGGANKLTREIASAIGAEEIITTGTDVNGLFAVDVWAKDNGLIIANMKKAMDVSSTLLADKKVYFRSDVRVEGTPPAELKLIDSTAFDTNPETSDLGIHVTACQVSGNLLQLIPQNIYIGIGCKRGTASAVIAASVDAALNQSGLDVRSVAGVATISLKANEPGLLDFCKKQNWTLDIYTAEELMAAPGLFEASEFVLKTTGADNVCERAASLASGNGKCLFNKYGQNGVTVAIYQQETTVRFGS